MSLPERQELAWVMVSYGDIDNTCRLAKQIREQDSRCRIIVVAGLDGSHAEILRRLALLSDVDVVDAPHNPGYMGGLAEVASQIPTSSAIVLSNVDLRLPSGFMPLLRSSLEYYDDAGMLAPSILTEIEDQNPHLLRRPTLRKLQALSLVYANQVVADLVRLRKRGHSSRPQGRARSGSSIYAGHGSCFIFTPAFRRTGGSFDYPCFLFGEEMWVGEECRRLGLGVRYTPELVLQHLEHQTTGRRRRGNVARAKRDSLRFWIRYFKSSAEGKFVQ